MRPSFWGAAPPALFSGAELTSGRASRLNRVTSSPCDAYLSANRELAIADHCRRRAIPIEIWPHIRATLATGAADEPRPNVGQPGIIGPAITADRKRVAAAIVSAIESAGRARLETWRSRMTLATASSALTEWWHKADGPPTSNRVRRTRQGVHPLVPSIMP